MLKTGENMKSYTQIQTQDRGKKTLMRMKSTDRK